MTPDKPSQDRIVLITQSGKVVNSHTFMFDLEEE
jgi:hypothetical protein